MPRSPELHAPTAPADRWLGFAALAAGLAMVVLDGTIVGVSLPAMVDDLQLSLTTGEWITTGYAMVFAALLLTFGRLGDRHGRRLMFVLGVLVFLAASAWCALAVDGGWLIAGRMAQGIGGAMVLPASLSSVNATFRGADRAVAFGLWGAVMAGAAALGPLLGGWLTESFGWRWIFAVNLPVGLAVLALATHTPESRSEEEGDDRDLAGLVTSALGLGLLVFGLIEGWDLGWLTPTADFSLGGLTWSHTAPISVVPVALVAGALLCLVFVVVERRRRAAGRSVLLDLSLFGIPSFRWGNLTAAMVAVGEFALLFVLPLYLVFALRLSIMASGWVLAAMALGAFVAGSGARHLAVRLGPARVVVLGLALELVAVVGSALLLEFAPGAVGLAALLAVYGLGLGLASAQLTSLVLRDVPTAQSGSASATQSTVRQLGSAVGAAAAGTALALGFTLTVPAQLARVDGVSAADAHTMIDYMIRTAGGIIEQVHDRGTEGYFGALGPQVVDALIRAFAQSAGGALWLAAGFIGLGLVGALALARRSASLPDPRASLPLHSAAKDESHG